MTLKWEDDPEKRLGLVVPFDCPLDTLRAEAEKSGCSQRNWNRQRYKVLDAVGGQIAGVTRRGGSRPTSPAPQLLK